MRIVIVDTYYQAFLDAHYEARPELKDAPYQEQLNALMARCFGTSDAYSRHLRALGHEATDVIANAPALQRAWVRQYGRRSIRQAISRLVDIDRLLGPVGRLGVALRRAVLSAIVRAQIAALNPEVVFCQDLGFFTVAELDAIRRSGRLVVGQIASPAPSRDRLHAFDLIVTSFPHFVERFRRDGIDSEYLAIAFYDRVLDELKRQGVGARPESDRPHAVTFVGGVDPRIHGRGTSLLEEVAERLPLEVWGYGADALRRGSPIVSRHHGEAWGIDMYRVLAQSRVVLNRHIDVAETYANNMRLYEATGVGALLVTEHADNLNQLFRPGDEVVAYGDIDQLVDRVSYLLEREDERRVIAAAGQRRTLSDHTYDHRMKQLAAMLEERLK